MLSKFYYFFDVVAQAVTQMLTQKDATIREDREKHAAELESMQQIGRALEDSADAEVARMKTRLANGEAAFKEALAKSAREKDEAVEKTKDKFQRAAEEQFEKGKKAYSVARKDLLATTAALEAQKERASQLEASLATEREASNAKSAALEESVAKVRSEVVELEARAATASKGELEALSICEEAVKEKDDAMKAKAQAVADKDNAFASLASATQELMTKETAIAKLKQELSDATANCEELLSLAESLQSK